MRTLHPRITHGIGNLLAACLLLWAPPSRGASDPQREWFTITTEHFAIHSYDGGVELMPDVARYAEEAWRELNPLLGWTPRERVHIVLTDEADDSNGLAWVMPYDGIKIYAYPPTMDSILADHDDWLKLLVFHEYTHIAHLDNAEEVPEALNTLLGKTVKPNQSLPRWFSEGVATWVESMKTAGGRVGSSRFEMVLRTAAAADKLPALSQLTGPPLAMPRGTSWYLYGSYLFDHIFRHAGESALRDYFKAYGRRLIPYAMNILARQTTGKSLVSWYDDMLQEVKQRAKKVSDRVKAEGIEDGTRATTGGEYKSHPLFTRDGRNLLYVLSDGHSKSRLVMAPIDDLAASEEIIRCDGGCGRFTVTRDDQWLLLSTARPHRQVEYFNDLRRVPLSPGLPRRAGSMLSSGLRARDPMLSPDGKLVWIVRTQWGRTWLEARHPRSGRFLKRWDPPARARMDRPLAHPDGQRLFATMHHEANRDLVEIDLPTGRWRRLTHGRALEIDPTLSEDGRWLVYSSDASGIYNLYARDVSTQSGRNGHTFQLTNTLTGAFEPALSPDGKRLVYVSWTVEGEELRTLSFKPEHGRPMALGDPTEARPIPVSEPVAMSELSPYSPLATLLPRNWTPSLSFDTAGMGRVGLSLWGTDISGRYGATLAAEWDMQRSDLSAFGAVSLGSAYPDLTLAVGRYTWDRDALYADEAHPYVEEVIYGSFDASIAVPDVFIPMRFTTTLSTEIARGLGMSKVRHTPEQTQTFVPRPRVTAALGIRWSFNDIERYAFSVSPAHGGRGRLSLRVKYPLLHSGRPTYQLKYRLRRYLTMPWLEDHVVSLLSRGGWSGGDPKRSDNFQLGGMIEQDLLSDLINQTQAGAVWLRGFEPNAFSGTTYHLLSLEYRMPIWRLRGGLDTLPLFARDISLAVFGDAGLIYKGVFVDTKIDNVRVGLGAELRLVTDLLFGMKAHFRLGYAHGFGEKGLDQVFLLMAPAP